VQKPGRPTLIPLKTDRAENPTVPCSWLAVETYSIAVQQLDLIFLPPSKGAAEGK